MAKAKIFLTLGVFSSLLYSETQELRQAVKSNGQVLYFDKQKRVQNFTEMFTQGEIYGRLRNNNFYFTYQHQDTTHANQLISGVGGSLIYRSARYYGLDAQIGFYYTKSFFDEKDRYAVFKAGKDTFSRFEYANSGRTDLSVLGQANIGYTYSKTNLRIGRQLVETFYTKSNDTKMIPNTFDGAVLTSKNIPESKITFAYLAKQKLRDHKESHALFMVGDSLSAPGVLQPQWSENDDSAMLKGLTYTNLIKAGKPTDSPLIILEGENSSFTNLKLNFSSYLVPELLSQVMTEANYKIAFNGFSLTPGLRYIHQFDNGAGAVAGASLTPLLNNTTAYKDPDSLNADMIAARLVIRFDDYKLNLGYTDIFDKADLVTPWRGFPTSGYTRSMGMYNWKANTKSYRIELVKGANAKGIYTKPFIQTSILYMDGDEKKTPLAQSLYYYFGIVQNIPAMQNLQYRVRLGYRDFCKASSDVSDYLDARFELNYLF